MASDYLPDPSMDLKVEDPGLMAEDTSSAPPETPKGSTRRSCSPGPDKTRIPSTGRSRSGRADKSPEDEEGSRKPSAWEDSVARKLLGEAAYRACPKAAIDTVRNKLKTAAPGDNPDPGDPGGSKPDYHMLEKDDPEESSPEELATTSLKDLDMHRIELEAECQISTAHAEVKLRSQYGHELQEHTSHLEACASKERQQFIEVAEGRHNKVVEDLKASQAANERLIKSSIKAEAEEALAQQRAQSERDMAIVQAQAEQRESLQLAKAEQYIAQREADATIREAKLKDVLFAELRAERMESLEAKRQEAPPVPDNTLSDIHLHMKATDDKV